MKLVLIEWADARGVTDEWEDLESIREEKLAIVQSVGWLVHDGKTRKVIVPHRTMDKYPFVIGYMVIPTKNIRLFLTFKEHSSITGIETSKGPTSE